jgi:hypothetical protein
MLKESYGWKSPLGSFLVVNGANVKVKGGHCSNALQVATGV